MRREPNALAIAWEEPKMLLTDECTVSAMKIPVNFQPSWELTHYLMLKCYDMSLTHGQVNLFIILPTQL